MVNDQKEILTPEELAAEQAAMTEVKEDEVRANIISEYGFDEVDDSERIDKLVAKEVKDRQALSHAIGQKIKHRTAKELLEKEKQDLITANATKPPKLDEDIINKKVDEKLDERFEKRDLESLEYPEELKSEIQRIAKAQGVSVKKAQSDPYIVFKIEKYNKEQGIDEASIGRTNKSGNKIIYSFDNPPKVDMQTLEGIKQWDEYMAEMRKQGH